MLLFVDSTAFLSLSTPNETIAIDEEGEIEGYEGVIAS
jgi:hypothetical protein